MMRGLIAISITMIVCVVLGVYGWLSIHHIDTSAYLTFLGTAIGPTIGILYNNAMTKKVKDQVDIIEQQTNGTLHAPLDDIQSKVVEMHDAVINQGEGRS